MTPTDPADTAGTADERAAADALLDAGAVLREPDLPGLATVLDARMLRSWASLAGLTLPEGARVDRVRVKPGTSVRAVVDPGDGGPWLLLHAFSAPTWHKHAKDLSSCERGDTVVVDPARRLLLLPAVRDRRLPGLARLRPDGGPRAAEHAVADLPGRVGRWLLRRGAERSQGAWRTRTLAHNPSRRWVGVMSAAGDDAGPVALLKLHRDRRVAARVAATGTALRSAGLRVPRVAPPTDRDHWAATGWVDGRHPESLADVAAVDEALVRLEHAGPLDLPALSPTDIAAAVRASASTVAWLDPTLGPRASAVADGVLAALRDGGLRPEVNAHGDLDPGQVVLDHAGRAVLLDLDRAALAPRGWDRACWTAALVAEHGDLPDDAPVLSGHGVSAHGAVLAAAALLRAPEPWRRRRPGRSSRLRALVELAEDALPAAGATAPARRRPA